jgi:integrase
LWIALWIVTYPGIEALEDAMARAIGKLAAVQLGRLPAGWHGDGGGLWLQVTASGARSWVVRFTLHKQARWMGIGPLHTISLAEARGKARECRRLLLDGVDPIEARRAIRMGDRLAAAKTLTFRECAERYIASHKAGWRNPKHAAQWPATLSAYVYPVLGELPVQGVDVGLVMRALEPIWTAKPETASRVRGRIEAVLDWATARGYRSGENPARWRGHLESLLPRKAKVRRVEHLAALPNVEMSAFIAELRAQSGTAARALEFAILTAARTGEVIGATWPEIDAAARLWTVPGARMKGGKEHRIPLSEPAQAILAGLERKGSRVFGIGSTAMNVLLKRLRSECTVHGFRSSFRDWAAERTGFPHEVVEMALAHTVGNAVTRAYQRSDLFERRRELAEAWARFCDGSGDGKVIEFRTATG